MQPAKAESRRIRILLADDHPLFRAGLRKLLENEPDFHVVGEAGGGAGVLELVGRLEPEILLLDVSMPGFSGLDALGALATTRMKTRTILLTAGVDRGGLARAIQLGIRGVVLKESATEWLYAAIRAVKSGQQWMVSSVVPDLEQSIEASPLLLDDRQRFADRFGLTRRESEILAAILRGRSNSEVGRELSISEETVKHHLARIFRKTGVPTRLRLILKALDE